MERGTERARLGSTTIEELTRLAKALVETPAMQALWHVHDAGMPVFAHSVDVTLLALSAVPSWQTAYGPLDVAAITIGSLLHDLTKATCRMHREYSHSWTMKHKPDRAIAEAADALDLAQQQTGIWLPASTIDHAWHIVVSHHGPWGTIQPATAESMLVHRCDLQSAREHRIAPLDANDALPLLNAGRSVAGAARELAISSSTLRRLLRTACQLEGVPTWPDLLPIWGERGRVRTGTAEREQQVAAARAVLQRARECPTLLLRALSALTPELVRS